MAVRWTGPLLVVAAVLLFSIANRGAYKGFFQADSLDNLALGRAISWDVILRPLVVPTVPFDNFRPVGMLVLKLLGKSAGLRFPPYVLALQALHLINAGLIFLLLRRLDLSIVAACAGVLFFVFHMALFSVYWEPMFVFDLLCGLFSLLSLLAYIDGRSILSFVFFWLAYRSKENAIMLPVVLLAFEFLLGNRRWKRLLPFFALSVALGLQALWNNAGRNTAYTLHFDPASVGKCIVFYSSQLALIPFAGLAILVIPLLVRNGKVWFGFAAFCALMAPMLALPGRLFGAYLYVPLAAVAICIGSIAELQPQAAIALLLALWIPWNYMNLRWLRRSELARADTTRQYVRTLIPIALKHPQIATFLYHDRPMERWGIAGAVSFSRPVMGDVKALSVGDREAERLLQTQPVILLDWEPTPPAGSLVALAHTPEMPDAGYIEMNRTTPLWQLERGWDLEGRGPYRWIQPSATARLERPVDAKQFEVVVNANVHMFRYMRRSHLRVLLDGRPIGERDFDREGLQIIRWDIDKAPAGKTQVAFEVSPGFRPPDYTTDLGTSLGNFGFITR